eukprot:TRINITY_DN44338_c0_g1_i2.p1 TRINITY_DN44338_c0_g1~~TRINITY_DN44338_c0_g1_i2.p1  ORF type:complete len:404 (+),score=39.20 TRINITY_DN44338_c0_g1_i2:24-1235(+)
MNQNYHGMGGNPEQRARAMLSAAGQVPPGLRHLYVPAGQPGPQPGPQCMPGEMTRPQVYPAVNFTSVRKPDPVRICPHPKGDDPRMVGYNNNEFGPKQLFMRLFEFFRHLHAHRHPGPAPPFQPLAPSDTVVSSFRVPPKREASRAPQAHGSSGVGEAQPATRYQPWQIVVSLWARHHHALIQRGVLKNTWHSMKPHPRMSHAQESLEPPGERTDPCAFMNDTGVASVDLGGGASEIGIDSWWLRPAPAKKRQQQTTFYDVDEAEVYPVDDDSCEVLGGQWLDHGGNKRIRGEDAPLSHSSQHLFDSLWKSRVMTPYEQRITTGQSKSEKRNAKPKKRKRKDIVQPTNVSPPKTSRARRKTRSQQAAEDRQVTNGKENRAAAAETEKETVSYTHLTLPTKRIV